MPTETTLNSLKVHKVPDFETWEENYDQVNGIGTSDVVVIPPEELKKGVLPDQTNNSGKFLATDGTDASWVTFVDNDTKNTAGSTNTSSKIYLIGATSQEANPQTYSSSKLLYSNGLSSTGEFQDDESHIIQTPRSIILYVIDDDSNGAQELSLSKDGVVLTNSDVGLFISDDGETSLTGLITPTNSTDAVPKSYVDNAISSHAHGNITSGGDITATAPTIANGDQLIINDHSASKITNGPTFDGSTTTKYLSQKGTWESIPTISYPVTSVNSKIGAVSLSASDVNAVATSAVGANSGVAPLNASGKIDSTYLPSYVDDVIEGYYYNSKFYTTSAHTTEITGETGKIFVDLTTNKTYRYGGSSFTEISQGSIVSVSRDLTSGTKIGTLTINGTGTDLYAPTPETFTVTGGASTIVSNNLTANRALISNASGKVAVSDVTSTELGYLDGVTSAVQTQIDGKQAKVTASGILKGDGSGGVSAATAADIAASHAHGNITSDGDITATAPTIASGDQIVINDHSASKITNGPTFDGSTTTKFLAQKGTWETPTDNKVSQSASTSSTWHKLLLHYTEDSTSTTAVTSVTNQTYSAVGVSAQPSTGTLRATVYNVEDKVKLQYNSTTQALDFIFI